ncbi:protein-disulfide reductase DsbD [Spongiibacter sp.]|uniref:protein-disulfide reductase DsbD family protein n=1 Tax=Spongiibacter sp. TaxID=2024860 RepID=UPI000C51A76E|nr:protein-disulfide reductase DsbD [Spongiibacter sp.]MAY39498.1 disulfide bond formation protein DsbD [Spongiibacter sp.]
MSRFLLLFFLFASILPSYANDPFGKGTQSFSLDQQPAFLPVEEAYQASIDVLDNSLLVDWRIAEGYYLYRERFEVVASRDGQAIAAELEFSPGKVKDDPYFGRTEVYYHGASIRIGELGDPEGLKLKLTSQGCADAGLCYPPRTQYFSADADGVFRETVRPSTTATATAVAPPEYSSLPVILLLAALGGAILNLMPCVFPVLGLKVLSFTNAHHGRPVNHGLVYSAGVVLSFVLVAGVLIGMQQAGQAVGWGFQLLSPLFVASLAALFFVLSLNLLGLFELGGRWMNIGGDLSQEPGFRGSFFTGVLATLVASPCTAPFMGSAIGYAATQPPAIALLVFASLGAGMALPVLLLTIFPQWLRWLPKPGQWMLHLRQLMAFPLLATAIWLAWIVGRQTGADGMAGTLLSWLLLGLAIWLWGLGGRRKWLAVVSLAAMPSLLVGSLQRTPEVSASGQFDATQITALRESGRAVFLDVTADWCITCAANEALVLNTDDIQQAFADSNVEYLVADWTRYDPAITALLAEFERNGIPLYVYYPADMSAAPQILPQVLNKTMVLRVLNTP